MNKITTELKEFVSTMPCAFALLEPIKVSTEEVIDFLIIYNNQKFITEINLQDKQPNDIRLSRLLFDDSGELIKTCLRVYKNGESENIIAPVGKENEIFEIGISFLQETISICLNKKHSSIKNEEFVTKENVFQNKLKQDSSIRKTLDNMPEGCAIISFDWIYLYVNETNAKHSHLTVNDMLGKNIHDVLPGIEKSDFYSRLKKCMELRELQHIEAEYIFPDGEIGWYEGIVQPVPDGIFILSIDITERKLAEKKQKKAENLYQTLFNSIDEGFCIVNVILNKNNEPVDYVFEEANHAFERQTGGVNIKGKKIQEMSYKHKEDWFRIFRNVMKTGESARFQERWDQQEKWYDVYAFPIGLPGELKIGILINDVTAHKHAEEVLIENQKLLQSTMDNLPTAIVYKDIEGRYINFNKVVEKVLGRKKEEIIGLTDFNLFPSEYAEKYRQNDLEVIRTGEPVQREEETILPDGKFYYMDISFPLKDFRGKIYGVGHISYDITEIRKINEELGKKTGNT